MNERLERMTNILVVDDDQVDSRNIQRAFEKGRISNPLFFASDGLEGLEILRSNTMPAERRLVLLDINMPRMNGLEMLAEMRADPVLKLIPVVVLTTSNDDRDRLEAYDLGIAGYMLKPVTFVGFVEVMSKLNHYWALIEMA